MGRSNCYRSIDKKKMLEQYVKEHNFEPNFDRFSKRKKYQITQPSDIHPPKKKKVNDLTITSFSWSEWKPKAMINLFSK